MPFFLYCHKPLNIISLWHKQKKNAWDPPKPILHTFWVHKLNLSRHCEPLKEPSKDKQALNHQEKCPEWVSKAARWRLTCGSMHVCKDMRHKKQHIAFHTAKEKEENPTRGQFLLLQDREPLPQAPLHKGMSVKEESASWDAGKHRGTRLGTGHPTPAALTAWIPQLCTLAGENSAPAAHPLHPRQSRISSLISLETCQEFPKPMKVKTEENKWPATNPLACRRAE